MKTKTHTKINTFLSDDFTAMADMFEGIQELPNPIPGCPNFRRIPDYRVFCCGQPSQAGFDAVMEKICADFSYPKDGRVIWINTRQEPCCYVNGEPVCARPPDKIGKYADFKNVTEQKVNQDEKDFLRLCDTRAKDNDGKLKYLNVFSVESEVELKECKTLAGIVEDVKKKYPGLVHVRIPMQHGAAPKEEDFDTFISSLVGSNFNTPVIINDHLGDNRATTGAIIACIFKEFQVSSCYDGLVASIPGVNQEVMKFSMNYEQDNKKDEMTRGEYKVIKKLMADLDGCSNGKKECDKIIDTTVVKEPGIQGLINMREDIAKNKMRFELVDDEEQAILKNKIIDNIQKYFYLIVFTVYMREEINSAKDASDKAETLLKSTGKHAIPGEELKVGRTFHQFMQEKDHLRDMIEDGKGDLKWERDIPDTAWEVLVDMADQDFDENLASIIKNIFNIAHNLFLDLPAGPDKKRATYRFATKTLLKLLPPKQKAEVDMLISKKRMTLDLYDIVGHCTWYKDKQ